MSWVIQPYLNPARAAIVKDHRYTGVVIGGSSLPPGTYRVHKGDTITVHATAKNVGEEVGSIWVRVIDKRSGNVIAYNAGNVSPGRTISATSSVTVVASMELVAEAGVGRMGQNQQDSWGC